MNARSWLILLALLGVPGLAAWSERESMADSPRARQSATGNPKPHNFVGAGSCAAAACHGAQGVPEAFGSEHTTWITRDRHARAYEVLFDHRSIIIQKNLGRPTPAHSDPTCLKCHVSPEFQPGLAKKAPYFRTDGVSCESCHGPAENWINVHHLSAWRDLKPADKQVHGMRDTRSLTGRARLCATCHVGAPGMEVDHDLLAAGHPRLAFEFTAFHAFMPRHWPDEIDRSRPDFEARAWIAGQLATARAALELLADRAGDTKKPWPEFARHDCAACHHDLRATILPPTAAKLGAIPWSAWDFGLTAHALRAVDDDVTPLASLQQELGKGWRNRAAVARSPHRAIQQLASGLDALDRRQVGSIDLIRAILSDSRGTGDHATQVALALTALRRAPAERGPALPGTYRLAIEAFARRFELPREAEPEAIRKRLSDFQSRY